MTKAAVILFLSAFFIIQIFAHEQHQEDHINKEGRLIVRHHEGYKQNHHHESKIHSNDHFKAKYHDQHQDHKSNHESQEDLNHFKNRHHAHVKHTDEPSTPTNCSEPKTTTAQSDNTSDSTEESNDQKNSTTEQPNDQKNATTVQSSDHSNSTDENTTTVQPEVTTSQANGKNSPNDLTLTVNSSGTENFYSRSAREGILINISAEFVVIYNERRNFAFLFELANGRGYSIVDRSVSNFSNYLSHSSSVNSFINNARKHGVTFRLSSIPQNITRLIGSALLRFGSGYRNVPEFIRAFQTLFHFGRNLPIGVFSNFHGSIQGDLRSAIERFTHIACLLRQIGDRFHLGNHTLNLGSLLNQNTGIQLITLFIGQLGLNVSHILEPNLQSPAGILSFIDNFGRNSSRFDLFVHTVSQIAQSLSGNGSPQNLIRSLIHLFGSGRNISALEEQWPKLFENFTHVIQNGSNGSPGLQILEELRNRSFSINGTNFSELFSILANGNSSCPISNIVHVLFTLSNIFNPAHSIPLLAGQLWASFANSSSRNSSLFGNLSPLTTSHSREDGSDNIRKLIQDFIQILRDGSILFSDGAQAARNSPFIVFIAPLTEAVLLYSRGASTFLDLLRSNGALNFFQQGLHGFASHLPLGFGNFIEVPIAAFNIAQSVGSSIAHAVGDAASNFPHGFPGLGRAHENGHSHKVHVQSGDNKKHDIHHT